MSIFLWISGDENEILWRWGERMEIFRKQEDVCGAWLLRRNSLPAWFGRPAESASESAQLITAETDCLVKIEKLQLALLSDASLCEKDTMWRAADLLPILFWLASLEHSQYHYGLIEHTTRRRIEQQSGIWTSQDLGLLQGSSTLLSCWELWKFLGYTTLCCWDITKTWRCSSTTWGPRVVDRSYRVHEHLNLVGWSGTRSGFN